MHQDLRHALMIVIILLFVLLVTLCTAHYASLVLAWLVPTMSVLLFVVMALLIFRAVMIIILRIEMAAQVDVVLSRTSPVTI